MKNNLLILFVVVVAKCPSAFAAQVDAATFFTSFPSSYVCQGAKEVFNEEVEKLGKLRVSIAGQNTENPVVEVASQDGKTNFKIGDGFMASSEKSIENCGYHFSDSPSRMFYVCGADITDPAPFQQVMRADQKVSFSRGLICTGGSICIRLTNCK